jgi:hypothetical protein
MIRIKRAFMEVLEYFDDCAKTEDGKKECDGMFEGIQKMAGIPKSGQARIDQESAKFRTYLILAQTLLHEFTHAFCLAYFEYSDDEPLEPWTPGDRCNEQGYAFENFVFGGLVVPMRVHVPPMSDKYSIVQSILSPFGFYTSWKWDACFSNEKDESYSTMESDDQDDEDEEIDRLYPVPQAWTQWLFSDDLWTDQVYRYGLRIIKVPKIEKWEIRRYPYGELGYYKTGEERWNTGENPDNEDLQPNWNEFYIDGIPKEEQKYKALRWDP